VKVSLKNQPTELVMIEVSGLVKRYGEKTAVSGLTFTVKPGVVTGFLGPNGAGKSTTMRMIVGLDRPTAGSVTVNGRPYAHSPAPMTEVGLLLEAKAIHPGLSAHQYLLALGATHGIGPRRVTEVLDLVGLGGVAKKRAKGFSLGMGQRLGIAAALLGDPKILILDEPVNGLDIEGVRWVRTLLKELAAEGRTVFLSSHLMSEMELTADHLIVIGQGRLIADTSVTDFAKRASGAASVLVRSPEAGRLRELIAGPTVSVSSDETGVLIVTGLESEEIGRIAGRSGITLYELTPKKASLEEAFLELTGDTVEYRAPAASASLAGAGAGAERSLS
jgi:ABC-2 type transport system ATP-binding protein